MRRVASPGARLRKRPAAACAALALAWPGGGCSEPAGTLYLTSGASDAIVVLDARDGAHRGNIPLDRRPGELDEPHGIEVSPDGRHLYATLAHGEPSLWKFELPSNRLVGRLSLGMAGAARVGVSPDGSTGYVPDFERGSGGLPGEVVAVDLVDLRITARARPCAGPHDARPDPTGATLAIACSLSDEVVFLDPVTLAERGRAAAGAAPGAPGSPRYRPLNLAWIGPDLLAVTLAGSSEVLVLDRDGAERARVAVGDHPAEIAEDARSGRLVVANRGDGTASILRSDTFAEEARVDLAVEHPHGVAVDPETGTAYVSYEGPVEGAGGAVALDIRTGRVAWRSPAGYYTLGVAFAAHRAGTLAGR
jgi:DNA-binding beta-propeller fold protein YncE